MEFAIVQLPAAAIRRRPRHSSEMVNQLLFGETVRILKQKNERWVKIRSLHDQYEGWTTTSLLQSVGEEEATRRSSVATTEMFSVIDLAGSRFHIPFGSLLPLFHGNGGQVGAVSFSGPPGVQDITGVPAPVERLKEFALQWLNVPYLWGGRTPLGVDCSGLVQVLFRMVGFSLPRDAWQQAQEGESIRKFRDAQPGDLLFFDEKEEIVHVGILFEAGRMIHCSGRVRMDEVDKKGLMDPGSRSRKLRLRAIRRIITGKE